MPPDSDNTGQQDHISNSAARPRLLDAFCCAGGAGMGYYRAGFDVVGVDIEPQPHYPFEFHHGDAVAFIREHGHEFDVIHASPPCQEWTVYRNCRPGMAPRWPDLIEPTRAALVASSLPYVIENVPKAPLRDPVQLCGTSFGIRVRRHRLFESNIELVAVPCDHGRFTERIFPGSTNRPNGRTVCNVGEYRVPLAVQKQHMQVDWPVTLHELSEAVPPAYYGVHRRRSHGPPNGQFGGGGMTETPPGSAAHRPYCPCGGSCHFAESPCSFGCTAHNADVRHRPMRALDDDATCVCLRPDDHPMHREVRLV